MEKKENDAHPYTKLVISGGSQKGLSYVGMLRYFEEIKIHTNFTEVVGTSIGSLFGLLFVIGYTSTELINFFMNYHFDIEKDISVMNFIENYGFSKGEIIEELVESLLVNKNININITFDELYKLTNKNLIVSAVCVNNKRKTFFSKGEWGDMPVKKGLRASMSLPIIFTACEYKGNYYLDGGLTCNIPISYYSDNPEHVHKNDILCVSLKDISKNKHVEINSMDTYMANMFRSSLDSVELHDTKFIKDNGYHFITMDIQISTDTFLLSVEEKQNLIKIGYHHTKEFFEKNKK